MFFENAWRCTAICSSHRSSSTSSTWPSPNGNWSHHNWNHWRRHVWRQRMKSKWTKCGWPTLSRRCWWWRCWFFALLENSTFELSPGIWTPLTFSLFHDMLILFLLAIYFNLFQSVSPGIARESSSPFTSSNILRGRLTKTQTEKSRDGSFTKKHVQMYNDVQISFFVYLSSHLRTISWITGRFKISASDRSGGGQVRMLRWGSTGDSPSWAPHGRWPLVGVSIQEFLGSEKRSLIRSSYDVNFMMLKQFKIKTIQWFLCISFELSQVFSSEDLTLPRLLTPTP